MTPSLRALAFAALALASPGAARNHTVRPDRGPLELVRSSFIKEGDTWTFSGRLRGTNPAHSSRRTVAVEARDDDGRVLFTTSAVARVDPSTVRHKREWTAAFRVSIPASESLRFARWSVQLDP